jgi:vacuolar-type H+-ATPase subunit B/Vma2
MLKIPVGEGLLGRMINVFGDAIDGGPALDELPRWQAADSNIAGHIEEVTMAYRRARQDQITTELLDVVAGFEALTGPTRWGPRVRIARGGSFRPRR